MTGIKNIRVEDYIFDCGGRSSTVQRVFEKQLVANAILGFKWTRHIPMGSEGNEQSRQGHQEDISALDIDDGDEMLIFGSHGGAISITKYKYLSRNKWKDPIRLNLKAMALKTLRWCPLDLRLFMVSTVGGWMRVCDTTMGKEIHGKKFEGEVYFDWNEYNTINSRVAVADGSQSMKLIDFRIGMNLPQVFRWDDKPVDVVQWYPSKQHYLYAGRRDGYIGVFDNRSTRGVLAKKKVHKKQIYGLRLSADGQRIISMNSEMSIHVADAWDFSTKGFVQGRNMGFDRSRPDLRVMNTPDLYVAENSNQPTVYRFVDGRKDPDSHFLAPVALRNQPFVFRKSSYELITGHEYNYLNVLSLDRAPSSLEDEHAYAATPSEI